MRPAYPAFVALGTLASCTLMNAPALLTGFGPVDAVLLLAAWLFSPARAALAVLASTALALPALAATRAMFLNVAVLHALVRPLLAYLASLLRVRRGLLTATLFLLAAEPLVGLTIALLYYADAGIETALSVYSALLAPFAYAVYLGLARRDALAAVAGAAALVAYWLSLTPFPAVPTAAASLASLALLALWARRGGRALPAAALALTAAGLAAGLAAGPALQYNLKVSLYPFQPASWTAARWAQLEAGCPPTGDVFADVYSPARLRIVDTCAEAVGTVARSLSVFGDGDFVFDIAVRPEYAHMLSLGSMVLRESTLHIEVVPADQERVLPPIGGGVCAGDVVRVVGVFVVDTDHGLHSELHPAYRIEVLSRAGRPWPDCIINPEHKEQKGG